MDYHNGDAVTETSALPINAEALYTERFVSPDESEALIKTILHHEQHTTQALPAELEHIRKISFMSRDLFESDRFPAVIWGKSAPWFDLLETVKLRVEALTQRRYDVGVCIIYPDGNSGVGYHSDLEAFGDTSSIPSLSLGAERLFQLREKATGKVYEQVLPDGCLLVMGKHCQTRFEHALAKDPSCTDMRVNVTFRAFGFD